MNTSAISACCLPGCFLSPSCSEHTDAVSVDNCVHSFPAEITGNKRSRVRSPALGINTNPR